MTSLSAGLCQSYTVNRHVILLVDSAKIAFCNNDTGKTIGILERIEKLYPTDALIVLTNKDLADLYIAKGKSEEAKAALLYGLNFLPTNYPAYRDTDLCNKIINKHFLPRAKADLCVGLSQVYLKQNQFDSAIYFLNLADNKFLPYKDCGNGYYMYKSFLSPYFADYYLAIGDTTKAINRLLDFFMKEDGHTVLLTQKLKSILLRRWTQEQIAEQVNRSLKELSFIKTSDGGFTVKLNLFGHTIENHDFGNIKELSALYRKDPSLKILRAN